MLMSVCCGSSCLFFLYGQLRITEYENVTYERERSHELIFVMILTVCLIVSVTEEDLDALCSNLKMDFNTYVAETAKAFTRRSMGDLNFVYQLKAQTGDVVDFIWKKDVGDIKV